MDIANLTPLPRTLCGKGCVFGREAVVLKGALSVSEVSFSAQRPVQKHSPCPLAYMADKGVRFEKHSARNESQESSSDHRCADSVTETRQSVSGGTAAAAGTACHAVEGGGKGGEEEHADN